MSWRRRRLTTSSWAASLRYTALGVELVLTTLIYIGGGVWLGRLLDRHWDRSPTFLVMGLLLGVAVSLWSWYEQIRRILQAERPPTHRRGGA
ncbi:MAG: AtpZ/AtpI family protein [Limnochordaceae bacterium]|nr:AtpZ/AtpI family protein [Limnochordaceae bacterium]